MNFSMMVSSKMHNVLNQYEVGTVYSFDNIQYRTSTCTEWCFFGFFFFFFFFFSGGGGGGRVSVRYTMS